MSEQMNTAAEPVLSSNDLAFERTIMSEKRTLMAWIRTSISMVSFGFTIYKFFQQINSEAAVTRVFSPRTVGMTMIMFGLLTLLFGLIEYNSSMKKLSKNYGGLIRTHIGLLSVLVLFFCMVLFLAALFRQ